MDMTFYDDYDNNDNYAEYGINEISSGCSEGEQGV